MPDKHLSTQFDSELNRISSRVMELGGLVERQISQAIYALTQFNLEAVQQVAALEERVNAMEVEIDYELVSIIGRRQPTARDLRMLMAFSKVAVLYQSGSSCAEESVPACGLFGLWGIDYFLTANFGKRRYEYGDAANQRFDPTFY